MLKICNDIVMNKSELRQFFIIISFLFLDYNCRITNRGVLGCDWRILTDGTRIQPNVDIIPWSYGQLSTPTENTGPTGDADNSGESIVHC